MYLTAVSSLLSLKAHSVKHFTVVVFFLNIQKNAPQVIEEHFFKIKFSHILVV